MKEASAILLRDARATLCRLISEAVTDNDLLGAFCEWMKLGLQNAALLVEAVNKASKAKGGERSSRGLSILGFRCAASGCETHIHEAFRAQLDWIIGKPNFDAAGDPSAVVVDPIIFLGICVGAACMGSSELPQGFRAWVGEVVTDVGKTIKATDWQASIAAGAAARFFGIAEARDVPSPLWVRASLASAGIFDVGDEKAADVLIDSLRGTDQLSDGFEAALRLAALNWAQGRALDMDLKALTVADVVQILRNVTRVFLRWTWEEKPKTSRRGAQPRKWHIENEYHVQGLLFTVLKPVFPEMDEEKYLASTGKYQPRADLCLPSLQLVIEVKYWYLGGSIKELTEQVASDHSLYLRPDSPYRAMIAVIWDDGARTEEYGEFEKGLLGLTNMRAVIFIPRPSRMSDVKSFRRLKDD